MIVRHVVAAANVDAEGFVRDPLQARHGVVYAGTLADLSGEVDALTHLNLDFPAHSLGPCVVAQDLSPGAPVLRNADGMMVFASIRPASMTHLGSVDLDARRLAWLSVLRSRRETAIGADV